MPSRQTIIEFQAHELLGRIIQAQDDLAIPDENMPPILEHIQNLVRDAEKRFLS